MLKRTVWIVLAASIVTALAVRMASAQEAGKIFRWKLKPGETLKFCMAQDMAQNIHMGDGKPATAITTKMTMDMAWKVDTVDDKGMITLDQLIERIQMKVQSAQGVIMEYDSASGKEPEGMTKMIAPMFDAMLKKPFRTTFSSRGELKKVKLPQGMLEGLNKSTGGQMGSLLSEDTMKQFGMMSVFPEGTVKPGQTWTQETNIKVPVIGNQVVKTTFRYDGPEARDGKTLDKISVTQSMKSEGKKPAGEGKEDEKKGMFGFNGTEGKGVLLFDNVAGRLVEVKMDMKMKLDMNVMGQKVTQDMDMKMRLSPRPDGDASSSPAKEE
jgi:hypothetical protein